MEESGEIIKLSCCVSEKLDINSNYFQDKYSIHDDGYILIKSVELNESFYWNVSVACLLQ